MASDEAATRARAADDIRGGVTSEGGAAAASVVLPGVTLPTDNLNEALPHLRRPFSPAAIKFKVQTVFPKGASPKGCVIIAYIDARLVIERLNAVVGGGWTAEYKGTSEKALMMCELEVLGRVRRDVGGSTKGLSKDLISDALKRAAVHFGVGVSVYALPEITWYLDQAVGFIKTRGEGERKTIVLTDQGHAALRAQYADNWLPNTGVPMFGEPLDHGDVFEDYDAEAALALAGEDEPAAAPAVEPLTDDRAVALVEDLERLYAEIAGTEGAAEKFPPAQFRSWLDAARGSHDKLEQLQTYVRSRHGELVGGGA